jgi:hypothetical protein
MLGPLYAEHARYSVVIFDLSPSTHAAISMAVRLIPQCRLRHIHTGKLKAEGDLCKSLNPKLYIWSF